MRLFASPADEPDEETRDRIFHLHDDPKDCDDPEIHFGWQTDSNQEGGR